MKSRQCQGGCGDVSCNKVFNNSASKSLHISRAHYVPQACHICGFIPTSARSLRHHLLVHEESLKGRKICSTCRQTIPIEECEEHQKTCNPNVICNVCGKSLHKASLDMHMRRAHTNGPPEKKYNCEICGKAFGYEDALKRHIRKTHGEKTPCPECGKKVRRLKLHIRDVHTPDQEKKLKCQDCGKGFDDTRRLDQHRMNVHLKLKPYNCRYGCDIAYNDTSNRNQHEKRKHGKLFTSPKDEEESLYDVTKI